MKLYHLSDYCDDGFPLAVWPVQNAGTIAPHRHDCIELVLITRGSGVCRINNVPYPVLRGDLYILNPHDLHSYEMTAGCTFYNILFDCKLVREEPELATLVAQWESASSRKLYQLDFKTLEAESKRLGEIADELKYRRPGGKLMARGLMIAFLVRLMRITDHAPSPTASHPEHASRIFEYIQTNLTRPVTIRELAKIAGMSQSALTAAFRQWTGSPVMEYIGDLRIRQAKLLLEKQQAAIGEIALRLGFYDACHFSRAFRRRTGISPRQYRQLFDRQPN